MRTLEYTYWQDGEFFIGHLNEYPGYETQGYSKEELIENLKDLLVDLESNDVPLVRKVEELVLTG
jgi:predicted RNase H-like HicB family nuclease